MNVLWWLLILAGTLWAAATGRPAAVTEAVVAAGKQAMDTALGLAGILSLWLGILRVAEKAGLVESLARAFTPLLARLFPDVPRGHPALGAITLNLAANALGLGSAATPMGLRAMAELQRINPSPDEASPAMCTFLALNTTGLTLLPTTVIGLRALAGSANPADVVLPTAVATLAATTVAVVADRIFRAWAGR